MKERGCVGYKWWSWSRLKQAGAEREDKWKLVGDKTSKAGKVIRCKENARLGGDAVGGWWVDRREKGKVWPRYSGINT